MHRGAQHDDGIINRPVNYCPQTNRNSELCDKSLNQPRSPPSLVLSFSSISLSLAAVSTGLALPNIEAADGFFTGGFSLEAAAGRSDASLLLPESSPDDFLYTCK